MTKPSRVLSNGREARAGSSLRPVVALIESKQATEIGEIGESAAPAITTSASPLATIWAPAPMASMPDVQPVDTTVAGPCASNSMAISLARLLGTSASYRNGLA